MPIRLAPHRAGSSLGLSVPTAHTGSKVHLARALACPLRSALRVWLPSRRFTPFGPLPALFRAGGAHGIPPSKRSPLEWLSDRLQPDGPTYRFAPALLPTRTPGRPAGPRFLGFDPFESPSRSDAWLAHHPPDAPLGFALPGSSSNSLVWDFAQTPLTRFALEEFEKLEHRRPRVSISHHLAPSANRTRRTRTKQPS